MNNNNLSQHPSSLDDPIAKKTRWYPLTESSTNFCTHRLVKSNSERFEFRATIGKNLFGFIFIFIGILMLVRIDLYSLLFPEGVISLNMNAIKAFLLPLSFFCMGGIVLYSKKKPIVFDKSNGFFWIGKKTPDKHHDNDTLKYFVELKQIHALQLLSSMCGINDYAKSCCELNLILKDGQQMYVISHGNKNKLRKDAIILSDFLGIPL